MSTDREIPVRPRVLYDRIHGRVAGDDYSRMLATAAGGTIPDKGLYAAKTEDGVTLGELDEEFVYESQIGDKFMLGSFGWRIVRQDKDSVYRHPGCRRRGPDCPSGKGRPRDAPCGPAWHLAEFYGNWSEAVSEQGSCRKSWAALGLDEAAAEHAAGFIRRQIQATGGLPDDRTIIVEHFRDQHGQPPGDGPRTVRAAGQRAPVASGTAGRRNHDRDGGGLCGRGRRLSSVPLRKGTAA